jgi:hypothetical protein
LRKLKRKTGLQVKSLDRLPGRRLEQLVVLGDRAQGHLARENPLLLRLLPTVRKRLVRLLKEMLTAVTSASRRMVTPEELTPHLRLVITLKIRERLPVLKAPTVTTLRGKPPRMTIRTGILLTFRVSYFFEDYPFNFKEAGFCKTRVRVTEPKFPCLRKSKTLKEYGDRSLGAASSFWACPFFCAL